MQVAHHLQVQDLLGKTYYRVYKYFDGTLGHLPRSAFIGSATDAGWESCALVRSHVGTRRSHYLPIPTCWKRLHLKLLTEPTDVRLACRCERPILRSSLCKQFLWYSLLFPIDSAPLSGGKHFHAQICIDSPPWCTTPGFTEVLRLSSSFTQQQRACIYARVDAPVSEWSPRI